MTFLRHTVSFSLGYNTYACKIATVSIMVNTIEQAMQPISKFRTCIKKLSFVDDTLELLGTPTEYHRMRNSIKWIYIIWFIIICTTWFIDSLFHIEKFNDIRAIFIPIIKDYPIHANTLMDIMYMFLLRYLGTRLDKINNHIEELSETEEHGLRGTWKKSLIVIRPYMHGAGNRKRVLWITMHLHSELCRIVSDIHSLFEIHMTLQMVSYFVILITMFYFQYHTMLCLKQMYGGNFFRLKLILSSDVWFAVSLTKVISFNHICESVSAKAKKTKDIIHKLTNLIYFTEAREEIFQFVLQISLRPLKFSALGLFYFDYKFIHKFFVTILTAVVFMLQMDTSPIYKIMLSNNMTCYD
ncbi:PREDICTED: uncharacterized protein LOC105459938 [Wasmannia auropunctata]|uniref:uncharacterized protein LOC105459938 n=1 Tax=Wasmannia auropunctata TaxID=64793 RepID=UPI0005F012D7|nr:PREDICTED: uncharacterized protein LOC105459938 [Wasmannia auropunctata]